MRLARRTKLSVTADSEFTVNGLSNAAQSEQIELAVLVEFDSGGRRCGVQSPQEAAALARLISASPGLHFAGLMTYPSNTSTDIFVQETKTLLKRDNIQADCVSGGGTPNMWQAHTFKEVTEHRAGTYVYGDRHIIKSSAMSLDDCALTVTTTVVSRPTPERAILDGGSKTFSSDLLDLDGYGAIIEYPKARIYSLSEEHGHVDLSYCKNKPQIGERLTVIPNHCCVVSNLFNQIFGLRGSRVEVIWPVAARGAVH
jgi:D-serine deaminase-like pyridoxal phosphate-dependent protein